MRRRILALVVGLLATTAIGGVALANGGSWDGGPPSHGHVMLVRAEFGANGISYLRCVELAAGKVLRGSAHHDSVHTGPAGGSPFAPGALFEAGNFVVPLDPLIQGLNGCEDITTNPWSPPPPPPGGSSGD